MKTEQICVCRKNANDLLEDINKLTSEADPWKLISVYASSDSGPGEFVEYHYAWLSRPLRESA